MEDTTYTIEHDGETYTTHAGSHTFYDYDSDGNPCKYQNYYKCECGHRWTSCWSSMCNDQCPECGRKDIEPEDSEDLDFKEVESA